ncbi:MAG: hypothetical protein HP494_10760 [Nitrospira sp.]|nr:hypothetical protein [Nitrospira sp.]
MLELPGGRGQGYRTPDAVRPVSGGHSLNGSYLHNFLLASLTGTVVAVDQVTKLYIMQTMRLHESIPVISDFFSLTYIRNPGAAFGLLAITGRPWAGMPHTRRCATGVWRPFVERLLPAQFPAGFPHWHSCRGGSGYEALHHADDAVA